MRKTISASISQDEYNKLQVITKGYGITTSHVIRHNINSMYEQYIADHNEFVGFLHDIANGTKNPDDVLKSWSVIKV